MKTKAEKDDNCNVRLISDLPAEKDEFGSHQRISRAIADLIISEEGGKSIGLEGGWGTGKSTIVNLLRQELKPNENEYKLIVFDAWAHEGDPLRRTFLETLLSSLKDWMPDHNKWERKRSELAGRWKRTEKKTIPKLTKTGKIIAVCGALFVPFGLVIFREVVAQIAKDGFSTIDVSIWLGISILLISSPVIGVIISMLTSKGYDDDPLSLLIHRTIHDEVTETVQSPDPTSVEFAETFHDLMTDVLRDQKRRLVLVLDNLDRIDPNNALAIIATLQTFISSSDHVKPVWFSKIWILLPYAPKILRNLWPNNKAGPSFLEKNLQIRFEVPPPVLSNWRKYLLNLLEEAFPNHPEPSEFHRAYQLFSLSKSANESPTPRDLKVFVNQIGTIYRQRCTQFPLHHMAYYVLLAKNDEDIPTGLINGGIPQEKFGSLLEESIVDDLSAIYFNVEPNIARQLLLIDVLENALVEKRADELKQIEINHPQGFWEVFNRLRFESSVYGDARNIANSAWTINESSILDSEGVTDLVKNDVRKNLVEKAKLVNDWGDIEPDKTQGIVALFRITEDEALIKLVFEKISNSPISFGNAYFADVKTSIENWVDAILMLVQEVIDLEFHEMLCPGVIKVQFDRHDDMKQNSSYYFLQFCGYLVSKDVRGEFWNLFAPGFSVKDEDFTQAFNPSNEGILQIGFVEAVKFFESSERKINWRKIIDQIVERISNINMVKDIAEIPIWGSAIFELQNVEKKAQTVFTDQNFTNWILHYLNESYSKKNALVVAWCIFIYLNHYPNNESPKRSEGSILQGHKRLADILNNPGSHQDYVNGFTKLLAEINKKDLLFRLLEANPNSRQFTLACFEKIIEEKHTFINAKLLEEWKGLYKTICDEYKSVEKFDQLISLQIQESKLQSEIVKKDFFIDDAGLYASMVRAGVIRDVEYRNWCLIGLREVARNVWMEQLNGEGSLIELVIEIIKSQYKVQLTREYEDPLLEHCKALMKGEWSPQCYEESLHYLPEALHREQRKTFRSSLIDAMLYEDGKISEQFFDIYGDELLDYEILSSKSGLISRLLKPLVFNANLTGLRWIAKLTSNETDFLRENNQDYELKDYCERLQKLANSVDSNEVSELANRIISNLGNICKNMQKTKVNSR